MTGGSILHKIHSLWDVNKLRVQLKTLNWKGISLAEGEDDIWNAAITKEAR